MIPFSIPMLLYFLNEGKIPDIVLEEARRFNQIVYGSQAMNIQLPFMLRRPTSDWDVYTRMPKKTAHRMQAKLDREVAGGYDDFYIKPAYHRGTHRVMHEGPDQKKRTRDDINIIDYTMMRRVRTVTIGGVRYERLSSIARGKKKTLKEVRSKFRHAKDRADLERIRLASILRRGRR